MDKLRYIFSLLADNHGHLIHEKYASFVQDVTCVPQGKIIILINIYQGKAENISINRGNQN